MPTISIRAGLALAAALTVAACSGASPSTAPASAAPVASSAPAVSTAPAASTAPSGAASTAAPGKVNANTASQAELAAAFAAAGISNADRWAREVTEYRPYPVDPNWAQLRQELGKYNIDPTVLEQIIALLEV